MASVQTIIDVLGGSGEKSANRQWAANEFCVGETAIFNWIATDKFPKGKHYEVHLAARNKGYFLDPREPTTFRPLTDEERSWMAA